ncbi:MAG: beta-propeller domain-containing protein [Candidatus Woesearchaeota archaeon]|nr:beta-propeller domain-containing protein [Candidatus Woesearchaeota archaeon]
MKTILAALMIMLLASCTPVDVPDKQVPPVPTEQGTYTEVSFDPGQELTEQSFSSVDELTAFIHENSGGNNYYARGGVAVMAMDETMAVAESAPVSQKADFSETNVQVQGVDEADIIKTDGEYIYTTTGKTLFIIAAGENAEIIETIELEHQPQGMFVHGDTLAVFGYFHDVDYFKDTGFMPRSGMTYFDMYDISDRKNPEKIKEFKFEGNYFQSRMKGDWIYFVTNSQPEIRSYPMPIIMEGDVLRNVEIANVHYYPIRYDNAQFATIHAIHVDGSINSETIAVEGSRQMYMSHENIYITATKYINEWELRQEITQELLEPELTESDRRLIGKIKATDNEVLSQAEKKNKIWNIYSRYVSYDGDFEDVVSKRLKDKLSEYEAMEFTVIHKVEVEDGEIELEESAQVPGQIVNQFSMDEHDGIFRIATTLSQRWNSWADESLIAEPRRTESTNNIYTLDEELERLDSITGIAEGERIFSTRFMGDRLYMVTFRQVDPFFVVDLSNPRSIKILGELKIPGFSRYLHPYDDETIIGIGRDATLEGRQQGLKISLFDVSNVAKPEEVAQFIAEGRYSSSTAEYEHKAFLFSREKNLLVIPGYSYDYSRWGDSEGYNGAMVFDISKDAIEIRGIIDHSVGEKYYGAQVERSLYIEDLLYTKSPSLLRVNELDDLASVQKIELKDRSGPYEIY